MQQLHCHCKRPSLSELRQALCFSTSKAPRHNELMISCTVYTTTYNIVMIIEMLSRVIDYSVMVLRKFSSLPSHSTFDANRCILGGIVYTLYHPVYFQSTNTFVNNIGPCVQVGLHPLLTDSVFSTYIYNCLLSLLN